MQANLPLNTVIYILALANLRRARIAPNSPPLLGKKITAAHCKGDVMAYDTDLLLELQRDAHLRQQRRQNAQG